MHRRILIIDDHNDLAEALEEVFTHQGHEVQTVEDRTAALEIENIYDYDLVITDLDVENLSTSIGTITETQLFAFQKRSTAYMAKISKPSRYAVQTSDANRCHEDELKELVATVLDYKLRVLSIKRNMFAGFDESIEFELPSVISVMHVVLEYLMKRVDKLGVVKTERIEPFCRSR